jgi:disulfide oxidoreductase YuzD
LIREIEDEMEALVQKIYPEKEINYRLVAITKDLFDGKEVSNLRFDRMYPAMIANYPQSTGSPLK